MTSVISDPLLDMMKSRWDCTCDACDREGRYHNISGQGKWSAPRKSWWRRLMEAILG